MPSSLSFRSAGDAVQVVTGCLKWPKRVPSSMLLVVRIMMARKTWSRLLSKTLALGQDRMSRQGGVDSMPIPWSSGWRVESATCPMRKIWTDGWTCHVSNGWVLCEVATCAFRGGPYSRDYQRVITWKLIIFKTMISFCICRVEIYIIYIFL